MISATILTVLGTVAITLSLLEIASAFVDSGSAVWKLVRRLSGRNLEPMSQMQTAMFWMQAVGLLLGGIVFVYAGLNLWGS